MLVPHLKAMLKQTPVKAMVVVAGVLMCGSLQAAALYYSIDLRSGISGLTGTPFISYELTPTDSDGDGWYETVLKINLRDPSQANPYNYAQFRVTYDSAPTGLSVNIGDSRTNDGGSGDAGSQSNDAELQIGGLIGGNPAEYPVLRVFGNDNTPPAQKTQVVAGGLATTAHDVYLTAGDQFVSWDNGLGVNGSLSTPFLFALNGQADAEGPVNYDLYAAFNRVVNVNSGRLGAGVGFVTVCLSTDASCFAVPTPATLPLALLALGVLYVMRPRKPSPPPR